MYNHYIPQSDGSFRRSSVQDSQRRPQRPAPPPPAPPEPEPCPANPPTPPQQPAKYHDQAGKNPLSFLKKLLPKELDTWDLIIIAFLLLLSSEESDDSLSPLLTVALYFLL